MRPTNIKTQVIHNRKLYFTDVGLLCHLLEIKTAENFRNHHLNGSIFETMIISELFKEIYNSFSNRYDNIKYFRDKTGYEIDCIASHSTTSIPIEIKLTDKPGEKLFSNVSKWNKKAGPYQPQDIPVYVVYGGNEDVETKKGIIYSWRNIAKLHKIAFEKPF